MRSRTDSMVRLSPPVSAGSSGIQVINLVSLAKLLKEIRFFGVNHNSLVRGLNTWTMQLGWKHGGLLAIATLPEEGVFLDRLLEFLLQHDAIEEISLQDVSLSDLVGGERELTTCLF